MGNRNNTGGLAAVKSLNEYKAGDTFEGITHDIYLPYFDTEGSAKYIKVDYSLFNQAVYSGYLSSPESRDE